MRLKLDRPICVFDLEATGADPANDRIVDICILRREPDGGETIFSSLVDPQLPIPPESTAIHKITDEMVRGQPTIGALAPKIISLFEGADLSGFNVLKFDIPMLLNEFKRAGVEWSAAGRRVADSYLIFSRKERRDLSSAVKFYCGREHAGAHRAEADVRASMDVLVAEIERYPDLPADMAGIDAFCNTVDPSRVDADGKFYWKNGEATFAFGNKHKGKPLRDVVRVDRGYIEWMVGKGNFSAEVVRICNEALAGRFPAKKA